MPWDLAVEACCGSAAVADHYWILGAADVLLTKRAPGVAAEAEVGQTGEGGARG